MKRETFTPILVAKADHQVVASVGGINYTMTPEAFFAIKDTKFYWDKRRSKTYPTEAKPAQRSLKNLIFGGRCYTISTDTTNLMPNNLTSTCRIEHISDDSIIVLIGNGKSFITDADQIDFVKSHKWSLLELKPNYFYVCYQSVINGKRKLNLFHRHVTGATLTSEHVDHQNWDTCDNRRANLKIVTLLENLRRVNPAKILSKRCGKKGGKGRK